MGASIVGVYGTKVGRLPDSSCLALHEEAAFGAIADAGLQRGDIDGVLCAYSMAEPHLMLSSFVSEYLGLHPEITFAVQAGGATACIMAMQAAALVESGYCRNVLVITGDNRLSGMTRDAAISMIATTGHPQFERPFGISVPAAYAMVARRYMHEYGTTLEQLAALAGLHREKAALHENSHMTAPITMEDVANSRVISSPLRMLDCCLVSDGGAALVISADEVARDLRHPPIRILGSGQGHTHEHILMAPSLTEFGCKQSSRLAFERSGLSVKEIDVAGIYDSFTITLLVELESIGFFERGEAGIAAMNGDLNIGGRLPCNMHGGLLSHGSPGAPGGMYHAVECVQQLRGTAGARQVPNARTAFVHGDGGILSAHCSMVLARD